MSSSIERVEQAARDAGLDDRGEAHGRLDAHGRGSGRSNAAARSAQIVKSLVFQGEQSGRLYLFLVSGAHQLDPRQGRRAGIGEPLARADPRRIRDETGFAIGGVSPLGHQVAIAAFADETLLGYDRVWAAAGAHDAVFAAEPAALIKAAGATTADLAR